MDKNFKDFFIYCIQAFFFMSLFWSLYLFQQKISSVFLILLTMNIGFVAIYYILGFILLLTIPFADYIVHHKGAHFLVTKRMLRIMKEYLKPFYKN